MHTQHRTTSTKRGSSLTASGFLLQRLGASLRGFRVQALSEKPVQKQISRESTKANKPKHFSLVAYVVSKTSQTKQSMAHTSIGRLMTILPEIRREFLLVRSIFTVTWQQHSDGGGITDAMSQSICSCIAVAAFEIEMLARTLAFHFGSISSPRPPKFMAPCTRFTAVSLACYTRVLPTADREREMIPP